jgi:hypothetical protein
VEDAAQADDRAFEPSAGGGGHEASAAAGARPAAVGDASVPATPALPVGVLPAPRDESYLRSLVVEAQAEHEALLARLGEQSRRLAAIASYVASTPAPGPGSEFEALFGSANGLLVAEVFDRRDMPPEGSRRKWSSFQAEGWGARRKRPAS